MVGIFIREYVYTVRMALKSMVHKFQLHALSYQHMSMMNPGQNHVLYHAEYIQNANRMLPIFQYRDGAKQFFQHDDAQQIDTL